MWAVWAVWTVLAVLAALALVMSFPKPKEGYANEPEEGLTLKSAKDNAFIFAAAATGADIDAGRMGVESKPKIQARDWDFTPVANKANTYKVSTVFGGTTRFMSFSKAGGKITLGLPKVLGASIIEFLVTGRGKTDDGKQQIVRLKNALNNDYAMTAGASESDGATTIGWKKNDMNDKAQDWILPKGVDLTTALPDKKSGSKVATPAAASKAAKTATAANNETVSTKAASAADRASKPQTTLEDVVLINRYARRATNRKDNVLTGGTTAAGSALNSLNIAGPRADDIGQSWELVPAKNPTVNPALNNATYKIRLGKPDRTKTDYLTAKADGSDVMLASDVSDANNDAYWRQVWVATEMNSVAGVGQIVTFKIYTKGLDKSSGSAMQADSTPAYLTLTETNDGNWGVGLGRAAAGAAFNTDVKAHWLLDSTNDAATLREIETYQPAPVNRPAPAATAAAPAAYRPATNIGAPVATKAGYAFSENKYFQGTELRIPGANTCDQVKSLEKICDNTDACIGFSRFKNGCAQFMGQGGKVVAVEKPCQEGACNEGAYVKPFRPNAGAYDGGLANLVIRDSRGNVMFNNALNDASARYIQLQSGITCDINPDVDTEYADTKARKLTLAQLTAKLSSAVDAQSAQAQALIDLNAKIQANQKIVDDLKLE